MAKIIELKIAITTNIGPVEQILKFTSETVLAHTLAELEAFEFIEILSTTTTSDEIVAHAQDALLVVQSVVEDFAEAWHTAA